MDLKHQNWKRYKKLFAFVLTMEEIFVSTDFKKTGYCVNILKRKHRTCKAKGKLGKQACTATAGFVNAFSVQHLRQAFEAEILQGLQWGFFSMKKMLKKNANHFLNVSMTNLDTISLLLP